MNDMRGVIVPKSDQINADDLLAGPMTITIREVGIRPGTEQPVSIHFEGDGGKPWKPCKSMSRVLVAAWGPDAKNYVGRSATLYCDPKVKWGGMEVGGIRISHLSHIDRDMMMALTATKGKRAPFMVRPLTKKAGEPVAQSVRPVAERADEVARQGVEAFRKFWTGLTKPERTALQPNLANYQALAKAADEKPAQNDGGPDEPPEDPFNGTEGGATDVQQGNQAETPAPQIQHIPIPDYDGRPHYRGWPDLILPAIQSAPDAATLDAIVAAHQAELDGIAKAWKAGQQRVLAAVEARRGEIAGAGE